MRTLTLKIAFAILTSLFLFLNHSIAQEEDLQPKSGSELIAENDTSEKGIPAAFSIEKRASIYAKRQGKKLGLDNIQVLKLTVRRLAYLKKMNEIQQDASIEDIEEMKKRVDSIRREYYQKFYELLTVTQRKKALKAEEIAKH